MQTKELDRRLREFGRERIKEEQAKEAKELEKILSGIRSRGQIKEGKEMRKLTTMEIGKLAARTGNAIKLIPNG